VRPWPPAFEAFVDAARVGRLGLWRFAFGILAISILGGFGIFFVSFIWLIIGAVRYGEEVLTEFGAQQAIQSLVTGETPGAVTLVLLAWATLWAGTWIAVRLFQRRRISTLFNAGARVFWSDFWRAAAATVVALVVLELLGAGPAATRSSVSIDQWVLWLLPVAAGAFVQTSAEEVVFRGYMLQTLAARFRSPWIWALVPTLVFVGIHFDPAGTAATNFLGMGFATVFALVATMLVWRTGNLGAAMGVHFLNNYLVFILLGNEGFLGGQALFLYPPASELAFQDIFLAVVGSVVSLGITALLLLEPRSPLRLRSLDFGPVSPAPVAKIED
jgi:membrane protease YdiL (CAAX protease family)